MTDLRPDRGTTGLSSVITKRGRKSTSPVFNLFLLEKIFDFFRSMALGARSVSTSLFKSGTSLLPSSLIYCFERIVPLIWCKKSTPTPYFVDVSQIGRCRHSAAFTKGPPNVLISLNLDKEMTFITENQLVIQSSFVTLDFHHFLSRVAFPQVCRIFSNRRLQTVNGLITIFLAVGSHCNASLVFLEYFTLCIVR